ncbi:MAG: glycosyltransferase [Propionibacteriaceae bacterium]|nr:glycosyltransferase [Propionibacteriaceae bacterium]
MVSAVIGFKDWGLERLALSIESIHGSLRDIEHEVIVCDYGSSDHDEVRAVVESVGAICARVETDGGWSRSRALNGGVAASRGAVILATDADMLFTPKALTRAVEEVTAHPQQICILQCRDLPCGYGHETVRREGTDWDRFAQIAQIRPRWGMGGLVAVQRAMWETLRGWDERMHTYGGEDIDFARRAQRFGARVNWLDEPGVAMYHIWHPSTALAAQRSVQAKEAIAHNRAIHTNDLTCVRNRRQARYLPREMVPIVSVVIPHSADEDAVLGTLIGVLNQTVSDIEVLVLGANNALTALDKRIRVVPWAAPAGLMARGCYVAVASSGEIWEPNRLEKLLDAAPANTGLVSDVSSSTVIDIAGARHEPTAHFMPFAVGGSLIRASLLAGIYPATSWDDLVVAVAESGAPWVAIGDVLRHALVGPEHEEKTQIAVSRQDSDGRVRASLSGITIPEVTPEKIQFSPSVQAITNRDSYFVSVELVGQNLSQDMRRISGRLQGWQASTVTVSDLDEGPLRQTVRVFGNGLECLAELYSFAAEADARLTFGARRSTESLRGERQLVEEYESVYGEGTPTWWIVAQPASKALAKDLVQQLHTMAEVTTAFGRMVSTDGESPQYFVLARTTTCSAEVVIGVLGRISQGEMPMRLFLPEAKEAGA